MILYFVCKVIRWVYLTFVVPFCCVTHRSHAIYTAVSRYGITSFFETPLNLTISFVFIFSRGFKQRISSELEGCSCPIHMLKTRFVYTCSSTWRMFCAVIVERIFTSFHKFNYLRLRCNFSAKYNI